MAQILLQKGSKFFDLENDVENLWWAENNWDKLLETRQQNGILQPFVLKYVDK